MKGWVGKADIVMLTLDTLRYDVAQKAWEDGELPFVGPYLGESGWQERHTPSSFTYAAHHAFMAGFLPTPVAPGVHPRLYASAFEGSLSVNEATFVFEEATLPEALRHRGYHTICVGGTGFFSKKNALSRVLPDLFDESHWSRALGVADTRSEVHQIETAIMAMKGHERVFLFVNIGALHQPNWFYHYPEKRSDDLLSHQAALRAVDRALLTLWDTLKARGKAFVMLFSDHGTAYGEDGYAGHRIGHELVWTVPYAEFVIS